MNKKPYKRKKGECKNCKKIKPIMSKGLCSYCYNKLILFPKNPEFKERQRKYTLLYNLSKRSGKEEKLFYGMTYKQYCKYRECCFLCGFDLYLVDIHHINKDKKDNSKRNLIPLCPNCHIGIHRDVIKINLNKDGFIEGVEINNKLTNTISKHNIQNKVLNKSDNKKKLSLSSSDGSLNRKKINNRT